MIMGAARHVPVFSSKRTWPELCTRLLLWPTLLLVWVSAAHGVSDLVTMIRRLERTDPTVKHDQEKEAHRKEAA